MTAAPEGGGPAIVRLLAVMARLRDPVGGCPWDLEQTFATIAPYTIEEAYEVADAIQRGDRAGLREELGDLLLQVVYHAQMAREAGLFDFDDVAAGIADKMVRRHPHVFGTTTTVDDAAAQSVAWEEQKARERRHKAAAAEDGGGPPSVLDDVPVALPALTRAAKLQRRAARVGFDWPEARPVLDKLREEIGEIEAEIDQGRAPDRLEDEIGDLLFSAVNLARHLATDPEAALRRANAKFERRFRAVEAALAAEGRDPAAVGLEELERYWQRAKERER